MSFTCKPSSPGPLSQPPPLPGSQALDHYAPAPVSQGPVPGNKAQPLCPRACCSYSDSPILNLLTLPDPFLPTETRIKVLVYISPALPLPCDPPPYFPVQPASGDVHLLLRTVTNYLSSGSYFPICWLHHTQITVKPRF